MSTAETGTAPGTAVETGTAPGTGTATDAGARPFRRADGPFPAATRPTPEVPA